MIGALGFHTERVSQPGEVIPALRRALEVNASARPAYIQFICSHTPSTASGLDAARNDTMPKLIPVPDALSSPSGMPSIKGG